jgi:hypothetical protein
LREGCRLRVFENTVLGRIFGPKRYKVTGEWRKLQNEDFNVRYTLLNIVRVIKSRRMWGAEHIARMGEKRCIQGFGGKPERKGPLGRTRRG